MIVWEYAFLQFFRAMGEAKYSETWKGENACFGMSWFWFPEAQFGVQPGVVRTRVGYTGGSHKDPTYQKM